MNNRNKQGIGSFVWDHIYWGGLSMVLYRSVLFHRIGGLDYTLSKLVLWFIFLGLMGMGFTLTFRKRRNGLSVFVNVLLPFEVYAAFSYGFLLPPFVFILLSFAVLMSGGYLVLLLTQRYRKDVPLRQLVWNRIKRGLLGSRTIITCCMSIVILSAYVGCLMGYGIIGAGIVPAAVQMEPVTLEENLDRLTDFRSEVWETLTIQEKMELLQTVADIEASYLGLGSGLPVCGESLEGNTLAEYRHTTGQIVVDLVCLEEDSGWDLLEYVCHEAYHAYQYELCELYAEVDERHQSLRLFSKTKTYAEEFRFYNNGSEDFYIYYYQNCEVDARQYADNALSDYYERINAYVSGSDSATV